MNDLNLNEKFHDAIFGLAIGDALGVPYEFEKRGTYKCKDMIGGGSHNQPEGTWSDDTSMTLTTLKSIKDNNGKIVILLQDCWYIRKIKNTYNFIAL